MFPRGMIPQPAPASRKLPGLEIIWLETASGKVESWLLRPVSGRPAGPVPAVIFGHGNGELIDFWPDELMQFTRLGMALLLVELWRGNPMGTTKLAGCLMLLKLG